MIDKSEQLPLGVNRVVVALCGDYDRRERAIRRREATPEVLSSYTALNRAIDDALAEVCEEGIRVQMRADIGAGRGARRSPLYFLSEGTYKKRKRAAKYRIARILNLL